MHFYLAMAAISRLYLTEFFSPFSFHLVYFGEPTAHSGR